MHWKAFKCIGKYLKNGNNFICKKADKVNKMLQLTIVRALMTCLLSIDRWLSHITKCCKHQAHSGL